MAFISAFASLVLLPIFGSAVSVSQFQSDNLTALFAPVLSTGSSIYLPGDPDYSTEITPRYSGFDEPSYAIAIKPATAEDVQNIVRQTSRFPPTIPQRPSYSFGHSFSS